MHFKLTSSLIINWKTKRHFLLLLFDLTPLHLNWPSNATGECYRSPRWLISTMKHWWFHITIHSLTIFKWKMCNLRLNLIYLSFFLFSIHTVVTFIQISSFVSAHLKIVIFTPFLTWERSIGGRVVKLLACGARGPGFPAPPLRFSEIGYLLLPSRDMAERSLNRR